MRVRRIVACMTALATVAGCRNGPTGTEGNEAASRWFQPQTGYGQARPAALDDLVFFATGAGEVIARDRDSGVPRWTTKIANEQISGYNFTVTEGVVAVSVSYQTVAMDVRTGAILWRYSAPLDSLGPRPPAPGYVLGARITAASGTVFIPAWGASVTAIHARTGQPRWTWRGRRARRSEQARSVYASAETRRSSADGTSSTRPGTVPRLG